MSKMIHILPVIALVALLSFPAVAKMTHCIYQNLPGDSISLKNDSIYSVKKICSCRLMQVKTSAFDSEQELVGIFAEKTLSGKLSTNYKILNEYIRREKIYFRVAFLESLVLRESFNTTQDCSTLYRELKAKIRKLRMYNIIDVDALTIVATQ